MVTVLLPGFVTVGARFTGAVVLTVMVKVCETNCPPGSVAVTVTEYGVALACPAAGVQLKVAVPLVRPGTKLAPLGSVELENTSRSPSGSLAVSANVSSCPSATARLPGFVQHRRPVDVADGDGESLEVARPGLPLSVTVTVTL